MTRMYLSGSKWSMQRKRKPTNWFLRIFLVLIVGGAFYFERVIVPTIPPPFVPTPTATRDPESYLTEARQYYEEGKLRQAIEAYKAVVNSRPDAATYMALARIQVFAGGTNLAEAKANAENALLSNANNSMAYAVLGWVQTNLGEYPAAETSLQRAVELDSKNALAHAYYAILLTEQYLNNLGTLDIIDRMSNESKLSLDLDPSLLEAHYARGYVLENTGADNSQQAISEYEAAIAIHGNLAMLHIAVGRVYARLQLNTEAIQAFTRADTLSPANPIPNYRIARAYAAAGQFVLAEQAAEQAVLDEPSSARYHAYLGWTYYKNVKYDDAIRELSYFVDGGTLEDGTRIDPIGVTDDFLGPTFYYAYGLALARSNNCSKALQVAQRFLTALPQNEDASFNAGEIENQCAANMGTQLPDDTETPEPSATP